MFALIPDISSGAMIFLYRLSESGCFPLSFGGICAGEILICAGKKVNSEQHNRLSDILIRFGNGLLGVSLISHLCSLTNAQLGPRHEIFIQLVVLRPTRKVILFSISLCISARLDLRIQFSAFICALFSPRN